MREITAEHGAVLWLGRQGEHHAVTVRFPVGDWITAFGRGSFQLLHRRCGDLEALPAAAVTAGDFVEWQVTRSDTAFSGSGQCLLLYFTEDALVKSETWETRVTNTPSAGPEETPAPHISWVEQVLQAGAAAEIAGTEATAARDEAAAARDAALQSRITAEYYEIHAGEHAANAARDAAGAARDAASAAADRAAAESAGTAAGAARTAAEAAQNTAVTAAAAAAASAEDAAESARHLTIDDTLTCGGQAADAAAVRRALLYVPIEISSFRITAPSDGKAELGSTVGNVTMHYKLNQVPASLELDDAAQANPSAEADITLTGLSLTADRTFTLEAKDSGSPICAAKTAAKTAALNFCNRIRWGAAANGTLNSAFVNALSGHELSDTKGRSFTVTAGSGKYIWYALPTRLVPQGSTCAFKVGGFDGGFEAPQTVSVTNAGGYTEDYYVYRSTNANLGTKTVVVS